MVGKGARGLRCWRSCPNTGGTRTMCVQRPPSSLPSPPGEGESFAVSSKNPRLDWSCGCRAIQRRAKAVPSPWGEGQRKGECANQKRWRTTARSRRSLTKAEVQARSAWRLPFSGLWLCVWFRLHMKPDFAAFGCGRRRQPADGSGARRSRRVNVRTQRALEFAESPSTILR
jgi:hypothetical protein